MSDPRLGSPRSSADDSEESVATASASDDAGTANGQREPSRSLSADAWRSLRRNPVFIVASLITLAVLSMAAAPSLWTSQDPEDCDLANSRAGPTSGHILGFSEQGCDYYTHAIYGAQPSIQVAIFATLGATLIGGIFGTLAGYYGGWLDAVISRLVDMVAGLPFLLGALTLLSILQSRSVWAVVFALVALGWPLMTRIMRANTLSVKNMDYVQAARSLGASDLRIIVRHVLPNAVAPLLVISTIALGSYVSVEASLTFLGVGLQPPTISWGIMIVQGTNWVLSGHPHLLLVPCAFLVITVLAFLLLGDAVRDALDPKLR